jgi:hypothetical protein
VRNLLSLLILSSLYSQFVFGEPSVTLFSDETKTQPTTISSEQPVNVNAAVTKCLGALYVANADKYFSYYLHYTKVENISSLTIPDTFSTIYKDKLIIVSENSLCSDDVPMDYEKIEIKRNIKCNQLVGDIAAPVENVKTNALYQKQFSFKTSFETNSVKFISTSTDYSLMDDFLVDQLNLISNRISNCISDNSRAVPKPHHCEATKSALEIALKTCNDELNNNKKVVSANLNRTSNQLKNILRARRLNNAPEESNPSAVESISTPLSPKIE